LLSALLYQSNEEGSGIGASSSLGQREEQRHIAVDPLTLKNFGGPDSLPGSGNFDEDTLVVQAQLLILSDDLAGLGQRQTTFANRVPTGQKAI